MRMKIWAIALPIALATGCSDDPVNVAGDYSVNITNGPNNCQFDNWTEGTSSTGISVTITQASGSSSANVSVNGVAGTYLDVILGSHQFDSSVDGQHVDGQIVGTMSGHKGNCTYQLTADLGAGLTGDTLTGTITYTPTTNHGSDCAVLDSCHNTENFNGLRPPK